MGDVFILGAGFSKAINDAMPTMKELSKEVIAKLEASPFPIQNTLYDIGENVELWMTYLSQQQPWLIEEHHHRNLALAADIRRHICDVIIARTKKSIASPIPDWLTSLISQWHSRRAFVITLNYDTLVERAAYHIYIDGQKGVLAESLYPPYFSNIQSRSGEAIWSEHKTETFSYFKLHGSTNLYYSGRDSFYGETIFLSKAPPWGTEYLEYEVRMRTIAGDKKVLIIPPVTDKQTFFNNETIRRLWREAGEALRAAYRVFVIGYSLPQSDLGMAFFLQHNQPSVNTAIYIVDFNPKVVTHYKNVLPKLKVVDEFAGRKRVVSEFVCKYPDLPAV